MKKYIGIFSVAVLALIIAFGSGCSLLPTEEELLPPKLVSAAPVKYITETIGKSGIKNEITGEAIFRPSEADSATASFPVGGKLLSRSIEFNQKVSKGDLIAVLAESSEYKVLLSTKQREVNTLKIQMDTAQINAQGGGEVALLKLALDQEQYNLTVVQGGGKLSDGTTLEGQKLKVQIAQQAYDNALATAKNNYAVFKTNYELAQQEIAAAQAQYNACFLYAPISGICIWTSTDKPGANISANAEFATIAPSKSIFLNFSSTDDISMYIKVGSEMTVTLNGVDYTGTVTQTPETLTPEQMQSYGVKYMYLLTVKGLNMADANLIGQKAAVSLLLVSKTDTFVVDTYLIISDGGKDYLRLLKDGLPFQVEVTRGISNATQTEILTGLSVGDQLIIG